MPELANEHPANEVRAVHVLLLQVAYFFLSTSYVTQYIENTSDKAYPDWFMQQINTICAEENVTQVKVNFDIVAFYGKK